MKYREDAKKASEARKNAEEWRNYFNDNIQTYHENFSFVKSSQWEDSESDDLLKTYKKQPMSNNKLAVLVKTIVGEQRQNTPNIEVSPDENATKSQAKIREALVKNIAFRSRSKLHYQRGFEQALVGGFSALKVYNDYEHGRTFNQSIYVDSFSDPTWCFWDKTASEEDKTDGMFCGVTSYVSRDKLKSKYGDEIINKVNKIDSDSLSFAWANDDGITIVDYYYRETGTQKIYLLSNNQIIDEKEYKEATKIKLGYMNSLYFSEPEQQPEEREPEEQEPEEQEAEEQERPEGEESQPVKQETVSRETSSDEKEYVVINGEYLTVVKEREAPKDTIRHCRFAGDYVLEENEVPETDSLPIVYLDGGSWYDENGRQRCTSFVSYAKDPQRFLNYLTTQILYILKNYRYDQFLVSKQNVRGRDTKNIWDNPAQQNGALYFDKDPDGFIPKQLEQPNLPPSLSQQYDRAVMDIYTTTGMYQARQGQQGSELSGKAIDARTRQGSFSTYTHFDNLNRAITSCARIINEMIPGVYDAERVIALEMPREGIKNLVINRELDDYSAQVENDIRTGTYTVKLKAGPSFEGQKEETLRSVQEVIKANPEAFNLMADLYAENLPLENAIEIRDRLKTLVPPEVLQASETGEPVKKQGPGPQEQALMQEQMLKQREIQLKEEELELKKQKQTADIQLEIEKLQKERAEIAADIQEQEMRYNAEMHRTMTNEDIARANNITDILTHKS